MYILPAIDIYEGKVVRLAKGDYEQVTYYHDDPYDQAREFEEAGAKWVHVVDLDGAKTGVPENIKSIEKIALETSLHVETGGGIRSLETIARLRSVGVSRIVLGTALVRDPKFAEQAIGEYGALLCAGIDAKSREVAVEGWCEGSGIDMFDLIKRMSELGYVHLVYTDISKDGMQTGLDVSAYEEVAQSFSGPVIASGGVADIRDIEALLKVEKSVEGVIVGRALYEGAFDLKEAIALTEKM